MESADRRMGSAFRCGGYQSTLDCSERDICPGGSPRFMHVTADGWERVCAGHREVPAEQIQRRTSASR